MAIKQTAEIKVRADGRRFIHNVSVTDEQDYDYLRSIWPALTGCELQWLDELDPALNYERPPWIGWVLYEDGWRPANSSGKASEE